MSRPVRVTIVRPSLPAYRIPVYAGLSERSHLEVRVVYGDLDGTPNAAPVGFHAEHRAMRKLTAGPSMHWLHGQAREATSDATDVLVLEWNLNNMLLLPTLIRARQQGIRILLWGHGYSVQESDAKARLRAAAGRRASGILVYEETTAQMYRSRFHYPDNSVFVAQNALDQKPIKLATEHWQSRTDELHRFQQDHDLAGRPVILHVSRLTRRRQLDVLVRAMPEILIEHPRTVAVIIGDGPDRDRIQNLTHQLGVDRSVRFVDGTYDEFALAPWFLSAAAFCSPSHLGLSLFHAFGYALPVVRGDDLSRQPPEAKALQHQHNGLTFASGEPSELASALNSLIGDTDLARALGRAGYEAVQERYTLQTMIDGFESAILAN